MLFKMNKNSTLAALQLLIAAFVVLAPSLCGFLSVNVVTYLMLFLFCGVSLLRINVKDNLSITVYHLITAFLMAYTLISSFWAGNFEGQQTYFFALGAIMFFISVAGEYFFENGTDGIRRRMMYMLSFSGFLCAMVNVIYWLSYIVPVAGNDPFCQGLSTDDFLSFFMVICIVVTFFLIKDNSKLRRIFLVVAEIMMIFVFLMAKSLVGWGLAFLLLVLCFLRKKIKSERRFAAASLVGALVYLILILSSLNFSGSYDALKDVLLYGFRHPFGAGGGFWSGRELFSSNSYSSTLGVGLLPFSVAASGIVGFVCSLFVIARNILVFLRLKTWESLTALLLCICVMFLPFGENLTVVLLWMGMCAYNEYSVGNGYKLKWNKIPEKIIFVLSVFLIITALLMAVSVIKLSASSAYENEYYEKAESLYQIAAFVNPADGESCRMQVASARNANRLPKERHIPIEIINKAIKRDKNNLENLVELALVYDSYEEYGQSAIQYREAARLAVSKDKYNRLLADELYKIVETSPKGSSETKRAYEEIVSIGQTTDNLELRKEINDIADKALSYTKGDLSDEGDGEEGKKTDK